MRRSTLHVSEILAWADEHRERTGKFPTAKSGRVGAGFGETWKGIDMALNKGHRGLPGKWSLAQLLAEYRGYCYRNTERRPKYTVQEILRWADQYYARTGRWPHPRAGAIADALGETWMAVGMALTYGGRGLPGRSSLAKVLFEHRNVRNGIRSPRLSVARILRWADEHYQRTGNWPTNRSGPVHHQPGETWETVSSALRIGGRGLRGRSSLARLLLSHRGVRMNHRRAEPLTITQILRWADAHHQRTGRWPHEKSGPVLAVPGENWNKVQTALRDGRRGLPSGGNLAKLWAEHRGASRGRHLPRLRVSKIKQWIRAYYRRHGVFPKQNSGPISGMSGETWWAIDAALKKGSRGLPGGSSLAKLIHANFNRQPKRIRSLVRPELKEGKKALSWASLQFE